MITPKEGEIIRNKKTAHPFLLVSITPECWLVVDLEQKETPSIVYAILPKDYRYFLKDTDMECYTVKTTFSYWRDIHNIFTIAPRVRV